ncbi:MAG: SDR family oxidoreductase [Nitrospirae bacterium]|nr:SDR family oxidoreductase [Candidatus Manganitrophaceae bacterium]
MLSNGNQVQEGAIGSVLLIGCGYVGIALARGWIEKGLTVYGTTRRAEKLPFLREEGIRPLLVDLLKPPFVLPRTDWTYFMVAGSHDETLPRAMANVLAAFRESVPTRFIYTSSTGVYGDYGGAWVDESSPRQAAHPSGIRLIETEDLLFSAIEERQFPAILTRLSGIYGPDRLPGRDRLLNKSVLRGDPNGYLNLIHLEDLIPHLMAAPLFGKIGDCYLLTDDQPVLRKEYYEALASRLGISDFEPTWAALDSAATSRRCRNQKMKAQFKLDLAYPSYREGLAALLPGEPEPTR